MPDLETRWAEIDGQRCLVISPPIDARVSIDRLSDGIRLTILTSSRPVGEPSPGSGVMTTTELAAAAHVCRSTISNWINTGKLDRAIVLRSGRRLRFSRARLRDMGLLP